MGISIDRPSLPVQRLSKSKKGKDWKEGCVKYYVGKYQDHLSEHDEMRIWQDLYYGVYDENDIKYVTDPFKVQEGFPAAPHNFNIIKPKIDLLVGELTKRPDNYKVYHTGEEAVSRIQQKKIDALKAYIDSYASSGGFSEQEEEQRLMEIEEFFKGSFVDEAEEVAYHTLNYLKEKLDLDNKFIMGFKDGLITRKEIHYCGILDGDPYVEKVNPLYFCHDEDPDLVNMEDGEWAVYKMPMTLSAIHDRLGDLLSDADYDKLLSNSNNMSNSKPMGADVAYPPITRTAPSWLTGDNSTPENIRDVYHVVWKTQTKIGFLTLVDPETGEENVITVDEEFKALDTDIIEWDWVTEVMEGYYIDGDIIVGVRPIENQEFSIDSPSQNKLPYIGSVYDGNNENGKSLVGVAKVLQYMYIIVWYRLELAMARDKGKVLTMDITQIPKTYGIDIPQFMHYVSALGLVLINPYEEGWDIPGREGGKPAAMNQFSAQDLSMSNVLAEYIALLSKIEEMLGEIMGVTRQRQGQVENRETKAGVEMAVSKSSHTTELLFWTHGNIKKRVLNYLLNCAKVAWARSGKKKLYYIMDDSNRAFLDLNDDFLYSDFGVFVTDSTREANNIEMLRNLLQPAMQAGATLLDAAYILTANNMTMIKNRLKDIEQKRQQMVQQQSEAENAQVERDYELENRKLDVEQEAAYLTAETAIKTALIGLQGKQLGDKSNPDLEYQKLALEMKKFEEDMKLKRDKLQEDKRKNKATEQINAKKANKQNNNTKSK